MAMGWDIAAWIVDQLSNRMHGKQEYTAAGTYTWTKPAGVKMVHVKMIGGGGGGGGGLSSGGGAGGGSGYFVEADIDVSGVSSVQCTVGSGGAAGVSTASTKGGAGGITSFGSFLSVNGGDGGYSAIQTSSSSTTAPPGLGGNVGGDRGAFNNFNGAVEAFRSLSYFSQKYNGRWSLISIPTSGNSSGSDNYGGPGGPGIFGMGGFPEQSAQISTPGEQGTGGGGGGGGRINPSFLHTGQASAGGSGRIIITW